MQIRQVFGALAFAVACLLTACACLSDTLYAYADDSADAAEASQPSAEAPAQPSAEAPDQPSAETPTSQTTGDVPAPTANSTWSFVSIAKPLTSAGKISAESQSGASTGKAAKTNAKGSKANDGTAGKTTVHALPLPTLPNPTTEEFIATIGEQAREIAGNSGLYASVMIAQAILESGSGSSGLSKPPYNNLFGIKGTYHGSSVSMMTQEDDGTGYHYDIMSAFRSYPSTRESLQDYADLLTVSMASFYAPAWKANAKTYVEACDYLQGHYATSTTYSASLQGLILAYDLERFDHPRDAANRGAADADHAKALFMAGSLSPDAMPTWSSPGESRVEQDASRANGGNEGGASADDPDAFSPTGVNNEMILDFAKSPAGQAAAFAVGPMAVALASLVRKGFVLLGIFQ